MVDIVTISDGDTNWGDTMRSNLQTLATAINQTNTALGGKYTLPNGGVPSGDLATSVRSQLTLASTAYQKPTAGIPSADLTPEVRAALTRANASVLTVNGYGPDQDGNVTVAGGGGGGSVNSVNGKTGDVTLAKEDLGLGNVNNTADADKPVSTAQASAIGAKYTLPSGGIPQGDLNQFSRDALDRANTAYDRTSNMAQYVRSVNNTAPDANGNVTVSGGASGVSAVNGRTGNVTLAKSDVGLGNVDNTADASKPVSTAQAAAIKAAIDAQPVDTLYMTSSTTTATINTFLAQGGYRALRGACTLTASLIVPSNTALDAFGATITGSTTANLIQNTAAVPSRTVSTGATTAGSATVTASGANFTSADVGRTIQVLDAGPNSQLSTAPGSLYATILSVTNVNTVVVSNLANLTTTGKTLYIYNTRDTNIEIFGGTWINTNKNSLSQTQQGHGFRIRRADNVRVHDLVVQGTGSPQVGGQYAVSFGDNNRVIANNLSFENTASDGIHFQGPAQGIVVRDIMGSNTGDDLVAFTGVDGQSKAASLLGDTEGDIVDVEVYNIVGYNVWTHLKLTSGTGPNGLARTLTKFVADGIHGNSSTGAPVNLVDYAGVTTFGGEIRNVFAVGATTANPQVIVNCGTVRSLLVDGVHWPSTNVVPSSGVVTLRGGAYGRTRVKNVTYASTAGTQTDVAPAVHVTAASVDLLEVDGTYANNAATPNFRALSIESALVSTRISIKNHHSDAIAGNCLYYGANAVNYNIGSIDFSSSYRYRGSFMDGLSTSTSTNNVNITATNVEGGSAWFLLRHPAVINISGCDQSAYSSGAAIRLIGTTATPVTITVSASQRNNTLVSRDGSQVLRVAECIPIAVTPAAISSAVDGDLHNIGTTLRLRSGGAWKSL